MAKKEEIANLDNLNSYILRAVKNEYLNRLKPEELKFVFAQLAFHKNKSYRFETSNLIEIIITRINQLP